MVSRYLVIGHGRPVERIEFKQPKFVGGFMGSGMRGETSHNTTVLTTPTWVRLLKLSNHSLTFWQTTGINLLEYHTLPCSGPKAFEMGHIRDRSSAIAATLLLTNTTVFSAFICPEVTLKNNYFYYFSTDKLCCFLFVKS